MENTEQDINKLIDINLRLICNNNSKEEYYISFKDEKGNQIDPLDLDPKTIALEMEEKGLIWMNDENCKLKSLGQEVCKNGGWLKHLELEKERIMKEKEENRATVNNTINIRGNNKGNLVQSSSLSKSPLTTNITANTNPHIHKNLIMKSWKLISENPLVSGLILAIVLYAIKVIFKIDLTS